MVFLFILLIFLLLILASKIRIEIDKLKFTSRKIGHFNDRYNIKIKLVALSKLPIFWLNINKIKIKKIQESEKFKNINFDFDSIGKNVSIKTIKDIKNEINFKIKKFYLKSELGTESTILTSMLIPIISTIIAIMLINKRVSTAKQNYEITPIYNNGNLLNLEFSGIFEVKMIHIIKVIFIINKKRRVDKDERTSNRGPYDYSYE